MFIKRFFYKITNREKYLQYKVNTATKRKIEWYKSHFEEKVINIQKIIEKQKEISFLHSGHLGDVIDSLAVIQEISKTHKCKLYIEANKPINLKYNKHPGGKVFLTEKMVNMLLPLLKKQNYIDYVDIYKNEKIDINLNLYSELAVNLGLAHVKWYSQITGIHTDYQKPYLIVDPHKEIKNKVAILRSNRRNNYLINYKFLKKYENLLFVGLKDEYNILKKEVPNLEFHDCKDFLETAEIIKSSKFFLGSLGFGNTIAEGLKVPRLIESAPDFSAVYSARDAYEFCFQGHFEKWFDHLYNV